MTPPSVGERSPARDDREPRRAGLMRSSPQWRVIAASVAGSRHVARGEACQDAMRWHVRDDGVLLAAVADGAGSAVLGGVGARVASARVIEFLDTTVISEGGARASPDLLAAPRCHEVMTAAFGAARDALIAAATVEGAPLADLATTLTVAVADDTRVVCAQVGDGLVVARLATGELRALTVPVRGEYANETVFLTRDDAPAALAVTVLETPVTGLALLSDGLLRLAVRLSDMTAHPGFFTPLLALAADAPSTAAASDAVGEFLSSPRVGARTDDDRTLLVAVPAAAGASESAAPRAAPSVDADAPR